MRDGDQRRGHGRHHAVDVAQSWNGDLLHDAGNVASDIGGFLAGPPGDPARIRQIAAHIEHVQHEYAHHGRGVNDAVDELLQTWTGTGSAAFRERWHGGGSEHPPAQVLSGAADQLGAFAKQLRDYADRLEHAQHEHWIQLAVLGALTVANVVQLGLDPVTDAAEVGAGAAMEVGSGLALADLGTFAIQGAFVGFASDMVAQLGADVLDHLDGSFNQTGDNAVAGLNAWELAESTAVGGAAGALLGTGKGFFGNLLRDPSRTYTVNADAGTAGAAESVGSAAVRDALPLFKNASAPASGDPLSINMETVQAVASRYGISFPEGTNLTIRNGAPPEYTGGTYSASDVDLYHGAFADTETLARTLFHERTHVWQHVAYGSGYVQTNAPLFEQATYRAEEDWWQTVTGEVP